MNLLEVSSEIPKKGHFIYFYDEKSKRSTEWDLMRFIAVKSFSVENPDYTVNYYTNKIPTGEYWERASDYCNLVMVEPPKEIYGNKLYHPAHSSDIFRINILSAEGGVYCDFDTITVKSFNDLLSINKFLIGDLSTRKLTLGNGVLASPPNSTYLDSWLKLWKNFRSRGQDKYWDELSVKAHRDLIKDPSLLGTYFVLPQEYFYPYSHYRVNKLFQEFDASMITNNTYSVHLYDSKNYKLVNLYTEEEIIKDPLKTSYTWLTHKYL